MTPKTLKPWSYVKNLRYDLGPLKRVGLNPNPEDYYFQIDHSSQIYTPVMLVKDFEIIPEKR